MMTGEPLCVTETSTTTYMYIAGQRIYTVVDISDMVSRFKNVSLLKKFTDRPTY